MFYIMIYLGLDFDYLKLLVSSICIEDIVQVLLYECCFVGYLLNFYSVV